MRKYHKKLCLEMLDSLEEAHGKIAKGMASGRGGAVSPLLEECQQTAIEIGTSVEESEGGGTEAVRLLEDYCEIVYQAHESLAQGDAVNGRQLSKKLQKLLTRAGNEIRDRIPTQYEAVFLPYKASMWDSLESVWRAADEDPDCDAYVIPIPYYDKNPDGSYAKLHYEGDLFPKYVPITKYRDYDFEKRHPDTIYIHNPYDNKNFVTEVQRDFFSDRLKEWTDELVYIPYFVLNEPNVQDEKQLKEMAHFVVLPGVVNADKVIVQSEKMREAYVAILTMQFGTETKLRWGRKISGKGSPKFDKVLSIREENYEIPDEWQKILARIDGTTKKVIFYNTSVGSLLEHGKEMIEKIRNVLEVFRESQEKVALLWRPHPLTQATIQAMKPELWKDYQNIVTRYQQEAWGIYDDSPDIDRAIAVSDAYFGDWSSVVWMYRKTGKPVMIQNVAVDARKTEK